MSFNSTTTATTSGAGTVFFLKTRIHSRFLIGVHFAQSLYFCVGYCRSLLSFFLLAIVLSVLLLLMASDYTLISSNFSNCTYVNLTQWQIYLKYFYVYLSISLSLPWNSIHSNGFRTFAVHKVLTPNGMVWQLTVLSSIVASCPDLDAQHLWASNHVSPSLKESLVLQINE